MGKTVDVDDLIDNQKFGAFGFRVMALALIALIADGYDVQVMAFAAPSVSAAWHIKPGELGPVLSAGLFGILFGAPGFGWVGDRIGRKRTIIISSILYGVFCLSCLWAKDLTTLTILRFLTGLGLGGVLPNAISVAAELTPRRGRAGLTALTGVGITIGGSVPGFVVAMAPPGEAFRTLFLVGGIVPFAIAALIAVGLPESVIFLVKRGGSPQRIARLVRAINPKADLPPDAEFVARPDASGPRPGYAELFKGGLALVTPLMWVMFAASLLSLFLLTSWLPSLLRQNGFTARDAALTNSYFQLGGVVGAVIVALLIGRLRTLVVVGLFILALAAVGVAARGTLDQDGLMLAIAACGFCLTGLQCSLNGTAGLAYPTQVRARGVGVALGVGRIGSVVGPMVAGSMVAAGLTSARDLFLLPILPLALGLIAAVVVTMRVKPGAPAGPQP